VTCTACTAEVSNGLALCARCQHTLTVALVNVAAYFTDVQRIKPGERVKVRSAYRSAPPPSDQPAPDRIAEALDHVATIVFGWCRNLEDDRPGIDLMPATTEARCDWLEHHTPTVLTLEWAGELLREIRDCERHLKRILDRSDTGWYAGVCGNEIGREVNEDGWTVEVLCERELYGTAGSSWITCPECGRTWDAGLRREHLMREARDQLAPVTVIARAVVGLLDTEQSVQKLANRIDQWVRRGRLLDLGVRVIEGKPCRVYRIGDVFDLLERGRVGSDDSERIGA